MKLSAPIDRLKREAKVLARTEDIPLHEALDLNLFNKACFLKNGELSISAAR